MSEREREREEGGMQRCPYLHEMRERLLDQPRETLQLENMERANLLDNRQSASESHQVGTVVKVGAVGCTRNKDSSHMQYQAHNSHCDSHSFTPIHLYKTTFHTNPSNAKSICKIFNWRIACKYCIWVQIILTSKTNTQTWNSNTKNILLYNIYT